MSVCSVTAAAMGRRCAQSARKRVRGFILGDWGGRLMDGWSWAGVLSLS